MKIWVVGNAAVDETMTVDAWPRPGMSVLAEERGRDLGGKGANQAIMIARSGLLVEFMTAVGNDASGDWIMSALAEEGVSTRHGRRCSRPTDRSVILLGPAGENAIITTVDCAAEISMDAVRAAIADASAGDGFLVQGNLPVETTRTLLRAARALGLATAFNPSPIRDGFAAVVPWADLLIVNLHEALALSGDGNAVAAASSLRQAGAGAVVVTLGADGALADTPAGIFRVPAVPAEVVDTTGAGDTFAGVLIARWCVRRAVDITDLGAAVAAAAITVGRRGARSAFPTRDELRALPGAEAA